MTTWQPAFLVRGGRTTPVWEEPGLEAGGWIAMTGTSMEGGERRLLAELDLAKPSSLVWVEDETVSFTAAGTKTNASYTFAVVLATVWQPAETMRDAFVASAFGASSLAVEVCSIKMLGIATRFRL